MKKFQPNKLKLNPRTLITPLLALSLMTGCFGLFGESVSAATATKNIELKPAADYVMHSGINNPALYSQGEVKISNTEMANVDHEGSIGYFWDLNFAECQMQGAQSLTYTQLNGPAHMIDKGVIMSGLSNVSASSASDLEAWFNAAITGVSPTVVNSNGTTDGSMAYAQSLVQDGNISYVVNTGEISTPISVGYFIMLDGDNSADYTDLSRPTLTLTYDDSACPVIATDPDTSTTLPSTPVTINVLGNDQGSNLKVSKIDGQDIVIGQTITLTNGSGTVKLNTDGTITFTPASTFQGESSFSYSITDGTSTVDTGAVKVTVASATAPEPVTPSQNNPTSTTKTNTSSTKPMLANTGENTAIVMTIAALSLASAGLVSMRKFRA